MPTLSPRTPGHPACLRLRGSLCRSGGYGPGTAAPLITGKFMIYRSKTYIITAIACGIAVELPHPLCCFIHLGIWVIEAYQSDDIGATRTSLELCKGAHDVAVIVLAIPERLLKQALEFTGPGPRCPGCLNQVIAANGHRNDLRILHCCPVDIRGPQPLLQPPVVRPLTPRFAGATGVPSLPSAIRR